MQKNRIESQKLSATGNKEVVKNSRVILSIYRNQ